MRLHRTYGTAACTLTTGKPAPPSAPTGDLGCSEGFLLCAQGTDTLFTKAALCGGTGSISCSSEDVSRLLPIGDVLPLPPGE